MQGRCVLQGERAKALFEGNMSSSRPAIEMGKMRLKGTGKNILRGEGIAKVQEQIQERS